VKRETTEVFEAKQYMNEHICSFFFSVNTVQLYTLFEYSRSKKKKIDFVGLHLLIIQLIKSVIRTISLPPETISTQGCTRGRRTILGPFLPMLFL
jgi:hypothetical protein